jgi:hypothetical protein
MSEEPQPKQFEIIAKTESLLEAPIFSKLVAVAFYAEFVLRHFYGISFGSFDTFGALRDFASGIKPLSLALIVAGAAVFPRVGLVTWRLLQELLFSPTYYFRESQDDRYYKLANEGSVMSVLRGKELARKKRDEHLLAECKRIEEEERKIIVTKINAASIFAITALNLILNYWQPGAGLILHNIAMQVAWLLATGIFAGIYSPAYYDWVSVPEGYTEEEIQASQFERVKKLSVVTGNNGKEGLLPAGDHSGYTAREHIDRPEFAHERISKTRAGRD